MKWKQKISINKNRYDYWKTNDGRILKIEEIEDEYLLNILQFLHKRQTEIKTKMKSVNLDEKYKLINTLTNIEKYIKKIKEEKNKRKP